ncbi:MAG: glycerol kinase GlpK [Bdellovibrio sp.]|nr:glycerol kinase GlpK [Bdellovibrio sp.]
MKYYLAIDQGTTGTTALLVDANTFNFIDKVTLEHPQFYPTPGHVEHSLVEIWKTVRESISMLLTKTKSNAKDIVGIGITNQRETTCAFDRKGNALAKAIVWQDRRTINFCKEIVRDGKQDLIKAKTGLPVDPYFSATKIHWLLNYNENVKVENRSDNVLFGTIDTYLTFKLSGGRAYVTEPSNASRTMLMNLKTCQWDDELLSYFKVRKTSLPQIHDTFGHFGVTHGLDFLPDNIPISCLFGDQQSALFGQACLRPGSIKCTYGTGAFLLLNTGSNIVFSNNGLLTTIAYSCKGEKQYAIEGSCYIAGAAVQWLRDNLKIINSSSEIEVLAKQVSNLTEMEFIYFLPFFTGLGSPYWVSEAKAALVGLTRDSGPSHIARACLEGICFSINDLIQTMRNDSGLLITTLKVDGGAVVNDLLMSMQATISNSQIIRPRVIETTAYGAALGAAIGLGNLQMEGISHLWKEDAIFEKNPEWTDYFNTKYAGWGKLIKKLYL